MQRKLATRFALIFAVLILGIIGIYPPARLFDPTIPWSKKHNLQAGIDIRGGTSLLYEIRVPRDTASGAATENLAERVAESLKKRVDPDGVRNLVWRPQGNTRLEIQMPLGGNVEQARKARQALIAAQEALEQTNIRLGEARAAVEIADAEQRNRKFDELAMGFAPRRQALERLYQAFRKVRELEATGTPEQKVDARDELTAVEHEIEKTNVAVQALVNNVLNLYQQRIDKAKARKDLKAVAKIREERDQKIAEYLKAAEGFPQRQAAIKELVEKYDAFQQVKGVADDAEDLKRLLRGSGVLEFRILWDPNTANPPTAEENAIAEAMIKRLKEEGPLPRPGDTMRWFEVEDPEQMRGRPVYQWGDKRWALAYVTPGESMVHKEGEKPWGLERAFRDYDSQRGEYVVGFQFDAQGSLLFGELTGRHVGKPLAIILDDKIISAPNLLSRIEGRGQISGNFTDRDLDYLIRTLNAGSLPARLHDEPISERTIGPALGADNLRRGLYASYVAVAAVVLFMVGYYYFAGFVASLAVLMNLVVLIGALAMFRTTFTLPGIAALALTVGMAVDANVLIFERLREEQLRGLSLRMALRNGYDRAWSAILDSNVTTIATSLILYWYGSEDIKGFGLTLMLGVAISMFTALFVTRAIFDLGLEKFNLKKLGSLPLTFPRWDQMLRPNVDWMRLAPYFYVGSTIVIIIGLAAYFSKGRDMYDIEFVSGTAVQVELKEPTDIGVVRQKLAPFKNDLPALQVVAVGDNRTEYDIITASQDAQAVRKAVLGALGDMLKVELPSTFAMSDQPFDAALGKAVFPIGNDPIDIGGFVPPDAPAYRGGVAIVLKDLDPPLAPREILDRIERLRLEEGKIPYRDMRINSAQRDPRAPTRLAVILVAEEGLDYARDETAWRDTLAVPTWNLVRNALARQAQFRGVTSFDSQVADSTKIDALVAVSLAIGFIAIYVWVRFGNFKYGFATIMSLLHDVLFSVGLIGMSQYIGEWWIGKVLLIEPTRMSLTVLAAVLTVMGYSVNDTIVVFDRIRENRGKFGCLSRQVINDSINQTLSRTLLTGTTTLATLFVMYVWGGPGIHGFAFALLFGIIAGTYSSIAMASPLLLIGGKDLRAAPAPKADTGPAKAALAR